MKTEIQPLEGSLRKIASLQGVSYQFTEDPQRSSQLGFIAQDVEPIFPEVIHTDSQGMKSMVYANLVAPLVEAVKEILHRLIGVEEDLAEKNQRIQALEAESAAQKSELQMLRSWACEKDPAAAFCR